MKKIGVLIILLMFLFLISFVSAECVVPTDGMVITQNTTFCQGEYSLPNGISIRADNVFLDCNGAVLKNESNSTIYLGGLGTNSYQSGGMIALFGSNNIIKNCIILNSSTGIIDYMLSNLFVCPSSGNNSLINNTIMSNEYNGIRLRGNNNLIKNNFIKDNSLPYNWGFNGGIFISGNDNLIGGNHVENNYERNIFISGGFIETWNPDGSVSRKYYGLNNTIRNNNISIGHFGISSGGSSKIINNLITNHQDSYGAGISLSSLGDGDYIENNTFFNNLVGIDLFDSSNNIIIGNKFDTNSIGIGVGTYNPSENNTIVKNNFEENNYNLYNKGFYTSVSYNLTAENNWWGTINLTKIEEKIYDYNDNFDSGKVDYIPFLCEPYPTNWISDLNGNCVQDSDSDGVLDTEDKCPNTIGEQIVYGCSCKQILALKPGKDNSNKCSKGIIDVFTKKIGWAKDLF